MARRNKVRTINGVKHRKPLHSVHRVRKDEQKRERLKKAGLWDRIMKSRMLVRAFGETEIRYPVGPVPTFTKFKYNKGKHFKTAGGSMRKKANRISQYSNYDNEATFYTYSSFKLREILDHDQHCRDRHRVKIEEIVEHMNKTIPSNKRHLGVLSHLNKKPE